MPNHKSTKKRVITNEKSRMKNKAIKSSLKTAIKKVNAATNKEEALVQAKKTCKLIDKAHQKGIFHSNNAARKKSRLISRVNAL